MNYQPKPLFIERITKLLKDKQDVNSFLESIKTKPKKAIRCNTLKITPNELIKRLEKKNWEIFQPFQNHPEIIQIQSQLEPGEIGKTKEHLLGYYYVQEITSMMPIITLFPKENDTCLDLCSSPGSKTTQSASLMENKGTIIANDVNMNRISILSANLERTGVTNTIITRHEGLNLISRLKKLGMKFDKILVDAPCSGEGNIRISQRTLLEWSENLINKLSNIQKRLANSAFQLLKPNGEMIYSTCTYSPEENEQVIQYLLDNNKNIKIQEIELPLKTRQGITKWKNKTFDKELKKAVRIYHHDNDMEGFFLCKMKKSF
jgi:NOL1/NOP2/sun family putative RNA methylase